jgi:VWFA-related protein
MPFRAVGCAGLVLLTTSLGGLARLDAQDPVTPSYRAGVDLVTVSVSVRRGNRPVTGLAATDFAIADNGVPQQIASLTYESLPVDATVVLDISGSVSGTIITQLKRAIPDLRKGLRPHDRLSLVTFDRQIARLIDSSAPPNAMDAALATLVAGGTSAIYDALTVAIAARGPQDRRQFVVLFSDGQDSGSITTPEWLLDVARRSAPTVSIVLASPGRSPSVDPIYADLAAETGGTLVTLGPGDELGGSLRGALDRFRTSYVLTYIPSGVERVGTHHIDVRVSRPLVEIRARRGYTVR